eukprot:GFKZ01006431.1.p1 GENE.GFKZ01006431.1~~GFKZ01006431.1.p1  ORF type:complete len:376 (-),score=40.29 GFKZ01006431.1:169-1221(-)
MLPTARQRTPLIVTRLSHALNPPTHPIPSGLASARHLCSNSATSQTPLPPPPPPPSPTRYAARVAAGVTLVAGGAAYLTNPEPIKSTYSSVRDQVEERIRFFAEPSREKLLTDAPPNSPRTLIIDLDRTLINSTYSRATGWRVAKRPGAEAFLAYMASFYEVVVFTNQLNTYADPILNRLDPNGYVAHRLYRAETNYKKGVHIKDLSVLNRDLSRVVAVDRDPKHLSLQPENALIIPEWTGDPADTVLLDLIPFLETLVRQDVPDVREELALLPKGDISAAVAEYRAVAAAKQEAAEASSHGLLFRRSQQGTQQPQPEEEEASGKGAVWGSLSRGGKIFHAEAPQRAATD